MGLLASGRRRWGRLAITSGALLLLLEVAGMLFVAPQPLVALPFAGLLISLVGLLAGWTRRFALPVRVLCVAAGAAFAAAVSALAAFANVLFLQTFTDNRRHAALIDILASHPPPRGMRVRKLEEAHTGGSSFCRVAAIVELEHDRLASFYWVDLREEVEDHYEAAELRASQAWYAIEPALYASRGTRDDSGQGGVVTVSLSDKEVGCF